MHYPVLVFRSVGQPWVQYSYSSATKPMAPSVLHTTAYSIQVTWKPFPSPIKNGEIFGYKICYKPGQSTSSCEHLYYVDHNAASHTVKNLKPNTKYDIEISAGTMAGYGPLVLLSTKTKESSKYVCVWGGGGGGGGGRLIVFTWSWELL